MASVGLKWRSILHALDHQANLDLEAMAFWAMTAFARRGWALESVIYAICLVRRSIPGM